jgi:hypothetical protein
MFGAIIREPLVIDGGVENPPWGPRAPTLALAPPIAGPARGAGNRPALPAIVTGHCHHGVLTP